MPLARESAQNLARSLGLSRDDPFLDEHDLSRLGEAWPIAVPTEKLLASGGDDRLALDPSTGLNKYGCAPRPRTDVISFASCTASTLSAGAYGAAESGRRMLIAAILKDGYAKAMRDECSRIQAAILDAFGCRDVADAILTASGTDAALVVSAMLCAERSHAPMTSIVVSPAETGSGVPLAVQGRHFADASASGLSVTKGEPVSGMITPPRLVTIAMRDAAGRPLSSSAVAGACEAAIRDALPHGHVVLHAIDGSKTGLTALERGCLVRLAGQYQPRLDIVIDACQARVEPTLIRFYLEQGFPVLVTGSKFFGAPGFCGAILFPRKRLARLLATADLPAGLAAYAGCEAGFGSRQCPGLLLRWTAALHEMTRFAALSNDEISRRLERIGGNLRSAVQAETGLNLVDAPQPEGPGWSSRRSVFTFTMQGRRGLLCPNELRRLYEGLQEDMSDMAEARADRTLAAIRCQIGQPVQLGSSAAGGLRLAISASNVVENVEQFESARLVLRKLALLSRMFAFSEHSAGAMVE